RRSVASFGVVPLRLVDGRWQAFLVRHHAGHWGFPKGRPEGVEAPRATAERELREEAGLAVVAFLPLEPISESYAYTRRGTRWDKTVTFYFATVTGKPALQAEEIAEGTWAGLEALDGYAKWDEDRERYRRVREAVAGLGEGCPQGSGV
ncbi:unnamed protein product, partial [Ostreobium quekettii]